MPTERRIRVRGLDLAIREWRPGGKPVLLLHGFLDHKGSFDLLAPLLPAHLNPIALDFPGHGDSDRRAPQGFYHLVEYVADAVLALRELGVSGAPIVGHSMGAIVALMAAAAAPDAVERVVALEGLGPYTYEPAAAVGRLADFVSGLASPKAPRVHPTREAALQRLREATPYLPERALEAMLAGGARAVPGGLVFKHDPALRVRSPLLFPEDAVLAVLAAIRCPVLALAAALTENPFAPGVLERRAAAIAHLTRVDVQGVNHHLHLEQPETVAALVGPFLLGA